MSTEAPLNSELEEALKKALEIYRQSLQALKEARAARDAGLSSLQMDTKRQKWEKQVKQFQEDRLKALEVLKQAISIQPAPVYNLINPTQDYALYNLLDACRKYADYEITEQPEPYAYEVADMWQEEYQSYLSKLNLQACEIEERKTELAAIWNFPDMKLDGQGNGSQEATVRTQNHGAFKIVMQANHGEYAYLDDIRRRRQQAKEQEPDPLGTPGEREEERRHAARLDAVERAMRYYLSPLKEVKEEEPESQKEAGKKEVKRMQVPYTVKELARVEEASKQERQHAIHFIKRSSLSMAALMDFYGVSLEEVLQAAEERLKQTQEQPPSA